MQNSEMREIEHQRQRFKILTKIFWGVDTHTISHHAPSQFVFTSVPWVNRKFKLRVTRSTANGRAEFSLPNFRLKASFIFSFLCQKISQALQF